MDRRIIKTRQEIRTAYFQLIRMKKDGKITITELTKAAKIDRKTFYLHYDRVDDIMDDFCKELVQEVLEQLADVKFLVGTFEIHFLFEVLYNILKKNIDYHQLLPENYSNLFWERLQRMLVQFLTDTYADSVTVSGDIMRIYSEFYLSGMIRLYQKHFNDPQTMTYEQMEQIYLDIVLHGASRILKKSDQGRE